LSKYAESRDQFFRRHKEHADELDGFQKIYFSPNDLSRYWLLTLNIPEQVVFADINSALNNSLFVSLLIGLIFLLIISWYISRKILQPVVDLASAANQLQAGDLRVRVDETLVKNEFLTLYTAVNAVAKNQQNSTLRLEQEVAIQTKKLSAVIDNIIDGIITLNEYELIESINPAAEKIFGYKSEEVIGQNLSVLMQESEYTGYLHKHLINNKKKLTCVGREVMGRRKDGSTFPMELAISEIANNNKYAGSRNCVGIIREITGRKQDKLAVKPS